MVSNGSTYFIGVCHCGEQITGVHPHLLLCEKCTYKQAEKLKSLRSSNARLREALEKYANASNWKSAGTYNGKPADVYLWQGWLSGIEDEPWNIAAKALEGK